MKTGGRLGKHARYYWLLLSEGHLNRKLFGEMVARLVGREARFGIPTPLKMPDWGLTPATLAWYRGADFDDLAEITDVTPGDVCRTFRMAIQLMRQVRKVARDDADLVERLGDAMNALNRDEVDARRQLEVG